MRAAAAFPGRCCCSRGSGGPVAASCRWPLRAWAQDKESHAGPSMLQMPACCRCLYRALQAVEHAQPAGKKVKGGTTHGNTNTGLACWSGAVLMAQPSCGISLLHRAVRAGSPSCPPASCFDQSKGPARREKAGLWDQARRSMGCGCSLGFVSGWDVHFMLNQSLTLYQINTRTHEASPRLGTGCGLRATQTC